MSVLEIESKEFGLLTTRADQQVSVKLLESKERNSAMTTTEARNVSQGTPKGDCLYSQLSVTNYKEKFDRLIKAEKESHEGILRERYNVHLADVLVAS